MSDFKNFTNKFKDWERGNQFNAARIYTILSIILISINSVIIKSSSLTVSETLYIRGLIIMVVSWLIIQDHSFSTNDSLKVLQLQSIFGASESFIYYSGIRLLSLSEATVIYMTYVIWSQFLALLILKEPLTKLKLGIGLLSLLGVILITAQKQESSENTAHLQGCLLILSSSVIFSISNTLMKFLGLKIPTVFKVQSYHFMSIVITSMSSITRDEVPSPPHEFAHILTIVALSSLTLSCHMIGFRAYSMVSFAKLAPYTFIQVLLSLISDGLVYQVYPSLPQLIGSFLIIVSIILSLKHRPEDN